MNKNPFYAKSYPKYESIQEHTDKRIENIDKLKIIYKNNINYIDWEILKKACLYHDLGKMNTKFQNKLGANLKDDFPDIEEIPHNYLSVSLMPLEYFYKKYGEDKFKIL